MSDSFLSQEEVDALLEGVTGESQKSVEEVAEAGAVRNYDISSQERIVRGRMPTMEIVNERFARNFRIGLFNFIRRSPEISVGTVSVQRYSARAKRSWQTTYCVRSRGPWATPCLRSVSVQRPLRLLPPPSRTEMPRSAPLRASAPSAILCAGCSFRVSSSNEPTG